MDQSMRGGSEATAWWGVVGRGGWVGGWVGQGWPPSSHRQASHVHGATPSTRGPALPTPAWPRAPNPHLAPRIPMAPTSSPMSALASTRRRSPTSLDSAVPNLASAKREPPVVSSLICRRRAGGGGSGGRRRCAPPQALCGCPVPVWGAPTSTPHPGRASAPRSPTPLPPRPPTNARTTNQRAWE